jgi:pimeloyl-ACP methyl ester carboxylesterase
LNKVQAIIDREPSAEKIYSMAELSFIEAKRAEGTNRALALNLYGASVLEAYKYLFDERFRRLRNPYDPQFRGACDLYNGALESALRLVCKDQGLTPGKSYPLRTADGDWEITCVVRGGSWRREDFGRFEFVSDYEINGLKNHYQTYGLGVPLIAVRQNYAGEPAAARYYPAGLSFPVTAVLRPGPEPQSAPARPGAPSWRRGVLELHDPFTTGDITVAGVQVPLESDSTTPLAYFLSNPALSNLDTLGLLRPDRLLDPRNAGGSPIMGLYMVQPYEPGKIPVLMVHGLWSSPMTWMEMFNDLRSIPEIQKHYQIWFYLYATAQPFWISAAQLRRDLAEARQVLDPEHREPALDQMVLIGHSMGGLISRLQTIPSRGEVWKLVSDQPLESVNADPEVLKRLEQCFFFDPSPSIRRVITMGTPHRGSGFSNQTTQWLAAKLIRLPQKLLQSQQALFRDNAGVFPSRSLLRIDNSIDALAPDSPIFPVMLASPRPPWVKYHNVVGMAEYRGLLGTLISGGDGVVKYQSAHVDDAESELVVPADHSGVHSHPLAVLEVRRILLEHLAELRSFPGSQAPAASTAARWPAQHGFGEGSPAGQ